MYHMAEKLKVFCHGNLMPKTSEKPSVSKASRKRVFGQGEKAPRAGLYARVSTDDQQTLPMQLAAMRDYAQKRGWQIAFEVNDVGSGAALRQKREELLAAARRREIDLVVVCALDRWGRSLVDLVNTLQELSSLKVGFVSLSEALDLTTPSGRALAGMSPCSPSSNVTFCRTASRLASPRPVRKERPTAGRLRRAARRQD